MILAVDISVSENNVKKCGCCLYDNSRFRIIEWFPIDLVQLIYKIIENKENWDIVYEDSNLLKSNWHGRSGAQNVGKNKSACVIFKQFLEYHKIKYKNIPPNGYSQFFKDKDFFKQVTGINKVPNSDVRAAIGIIYKNYKVLPISLKE
jgi:hypothetical protein